MQTLLPFSSAMGIFVLFRRLKVDKVDPCVFAMMTLPSSSPHSATDAPSLWMIFTDLLAGYVTELNDVSACRFQNAQLWFILILHVLRLCRYFRDVRRFRPDEVPTRDRRCRDFLFELYPDLETSLVRDEEEALVIEAAVRHARPGPVGHVRIVFLLLRCPVPPGTGWGRLAGAARAARGPYCSTTMPRYLPKNWRSDRSIICVVSRLITVPLSFLFPLVAAEHLQVISLSLGQNSAIRPAPRRS